jgi:PadR family transcriptional regulator AphA
MAGDDLVESEVEAQDGRPDRRVYTITGAGVTALDAWLAQPIVDIPPKKELLLLKLFFSARVEKQDILTQLNLQRGLHQQQADLYKGHTKSAIEKFAFKTPDRVKDALLWDAARRYGELLEEMSVRWLDEIIATVEENF